MQQLTALPPDSPLRSPGKGHVELVDEASFATWRTAEAPPDAVYDGEELAEKPTTADFAEAEDEAPPEPPTVMQCRMLEEAYDRDKGGVRFQVLWHRVRNKSGAPSNKQVKLWLAEQTEAKKKAQAESATPKMKKVNGMFVFEPAPAPPAAAEPAPTQTPDPEAPGAAAKEEEPAADPFVPKKGGFVAPIPVRKKVTTPASDTAGGLYDNPPDAAPAPVSAAPPVVAPQTPTDTAAAEGPVASIAPAETTSSAAGGTVESAGAGGAATAARAKLQVAIDETKVENKKTFYRIRVQASGLSFAAPSGDVWHRYSQFDALRKALIKQEKDGTINYSIKTLPFPKKKIGGGSKAPVVEARKGAQPRRRTDLVAVICILLRIFVEYC
eukprot:SAG31_NODE_2107_length_6428_cov_68.955917_2_plen_383_part_00